MVQYQEVQYQIVRHWYGAMLIVQYQDSATCNSEASNSATMWQ